MPLYQYKCDVCGDYKSEIKSISDRNDCPVCCGEKTRRIIPHFNLITDTNFGYTGRIDRRLGNTPIEGRKDFWNRVRQRGLQEIDLKSMDGSKTFKNRMENQKKKLIATMDGKGQS